jgi:uncharacterized protein YdiU (UPF0061 family)
MTDTHSFRFDNSYGQLPDRFFIRMAPVPVAAPRTIKINKGLADQLGLDFDQLKSLDGAEVFSGNRVLEGSDPLAMAYGGHQFGGWSPRLGDGRAILLGEIFDKDNARFDMMLKGSGSTPFSRGGDGRAALGPVLREYIVAEAMAALGVPTTRALAAVATGEMVIREETLPGAILTRIAQSHVRVGTFEYFGAQGDVEATKLLADHVIDRHYPDARETENPYRALLEYVIAKQAALVARWQSIGFIHGVMNTDNVSIVGETIDYGPCAFMDSYHAGQVYSSIDRQGRYAYGNQPGITHWNVSCLAQALLPLLAVDQDEAIVIAKEVLLEFPDLFETAYMEDFRKKLGLSDVIEGDIGLTNDLLQHMEDGNADFTLTFRALSGLSTEETSADDIARELFDEPDGFNVWAKEWRMRLAQDKQSDTERQSAMRLVNPAVIPRNHLVEEAIIAATKNDDFSVFENLVAVLEKPFDDQPEGSKYLLPPRDDQVVQATFCGT